jgi:regulatory protein
VATRSRPGSPVAEAAEWLTRQGIAVPAPAQSDTFGETEAATAVGTPGAGRPASRLPVGPGVAEPRATSAGEEPAPGPDAEPGGEPEADPYAVARSIALDRIAARDRTRHELAQALKTKKVPSEVAEQVLDRLEAVGLVNDAAFAEAWVESRQQRRHLSRPALRRELQAKGVDRDQIDAALDTVHPGDELTAARELTRRRHPTVAELPYPVRYRRLAGALSRRGFGPAIVTQVLREVLGEE